MFSNFKDAFVKRPQYTLSPQSAITDAINAEIPEGFEYKYVGEGFYILDTVLGLDIQSGRVKIPEEAKCFFESDDNIDIEKIQRYAYNAQTSIEIVPDKDGCFDVNGGKVKAQNFMKAPLKKFKTEEFHFMMVPPPFPKPFPVTVSGDGYSLELLIQRKAMSSIDEAAFETVKESPIILNY